MKDATRLFKIENETIEIFRECKTLSELDECVNIICTTINRLCSIRCSEINNLNINERIIAEVIKEFAERLKEKQKEYEYYLGCYMKYVSIDDIDNLVKEMVGEHK